MDEYPATGQGLLGNNMFGFCHNNPVIYVDDEGESPRIYDADLRAVVAGVALMGAAFVKEAKQPNTKWVDNAISAVKRASKKLVDSTKKRWDDSQPCVHHVVPQSCSCSHATNARKKMADVQSVTNLVIINYKTHKAIHSSGHLYCSSVDSTLEALGTERGMVVVKITILLEAASNGGYFYGWF